MNPFRSPDRPDWRWARATELAQFSETQAVARLRDSDDSLRRTYRFRRALDRNCGDVEDGALAGAYEIYQNDLSMRCFIEGLLLTGEDYVDIASCTGEHVELIRAYHDSFFAVGPWLKHPMKICSMVFNGFPHHFSHERDRLGVAHRIAWFGGKGFLLEYCSTGANPTIWPRLVELMKRFLLQNGVETALTATRHGENSVDFIKVALESNEEKKKASSSNTQAAEDFQRELNDFVEKLAPSITVADPTLDRNLKLPPRELRETEYEVTNG